MVTNPAPVKVGAALRQLSDAVPPAKLVVGGYNVTYRREECDTAMLALPENDDPAPLLAFRRAGLGRTLAFTGELSGPHSAPLMTSEYGAGDYASHQSADAEANLLNPQMNVPFM